MHLFLTEIICEGFFVRMFYMKILDVCFIISVSFHTFAVLKKERCPSG